MAIECGFYTGQSITAELLNTAFAGVISNGVRLADEADELQVVSNSNMLIDVKAGYAVIEGSILHNTDNYTLTVETADGTLDRIDRVVARQDLSTSPVSNTIVIIEGSLSDEAVAPDLVRDGTYYDLGLATISVPAGTTAITQDLITDTRFDSEVCGELHAFAQDVDLGGYLENISAQLQAFLGQMSEGDIATSLQLQCNNLSSKTLNTTLSASNWSGTEAPYTYTVSWTGVTADSVVTIGQPYNNTADQLDAWTNAGIYSGVTAGGQVTFYAKGDKPTIDIPVELTRRDK